MSGDLTFLTNEANRSLLRRLEVLMASTQFFDCLVGYFFVSGFYKLYKSLEHVEKVRILVGLSTDKNTYNLIQQSKEQSEIPLMSQAQIIEKAPDAILDELEHSDDSVDVEEGVTKFIEWLKSGKLEIRSYPDERIHAKVYVMSFVSGDRDAGRVITGSSNLTQSGLRDNLEFNVELKSRADYDYAKEKFEELWQKATDLSITYDDTIRNKSPFAQFTPYELYLKFLYEYFKEELNLPDNLEDIYVPEGFIKLKYQEDAVVSAKKVLEEYGGLFLSDVVGLGKTYMSALLAQQLDGRSLVIAPPHLLDKNNRGSWPNVFGDFRVPHTDFESIGKLESILSRDVSKYKNIFIDESHRFRTEMNQTYAMLAQICRGKRVILVSATPLNNSPDDILSQMKLFQNGKNSTIPNVRNLEAFFSHLKKKLQGLDRKTDRDEYIRIVQENAAQTRNYILKYLMVRRTRNDIIKYYADDLKSQGLTFPKVADPEPLFYQFNATENAIFLDTMKIITQSFVYARYRPLTYYKGDVDHRDIQGQRNLTKFMKILLIKRLESSFYAFKLTIDRFLKSYERVIKEFEKGHVYISKKHITKIFELLDAADYDTIEKYLEADKAIKLDAKDFHPDFIKHLKSDLATLEDIQKTWATLTHDPKWETFADVLKVDKHINKSKAIIFTESKETAEYLFNRISKEIDPKALLFSGSSSELHRKEVISNFDAKAYDPKDDFRILITTEVLSEGINLHRSNIVINYDIPWNPTRLIQRVGRINRVDTAFKEIYTYNFFPTEECNDAIKLKEAAEAKIHAFIEMLGNDARLLTDGEEVKSHDLFAKLNSKQTITGEQEEEDSELEYLTEIRKIRDENPDLFTRIKRLPKKARSTKLMLSQGSKHNLELPGLLTYFRQGRLDKFFVSTIASKDSLELDFFQSVRILKPDDVNENRKEIPLHFYEMLAKNKSAFEFATSIESEEQMQSHKGNTNEVYITKRLKSNEVKKYHGFTDIEDDYITSVIKLLNDGALPKHTAKKIADKLKNEADPLKILGILKSNISPDFFNPVIAKDASQAFKPREVILSSYLLEGK